MEKIKAREQKSFKLRLIRDIKKHKWVWIMAFPIVLYYIIFCYIPLGGVVIAFMDYRPGKGILESDWAGLKHFISFLTGPYSGRVISNTVIINVMHLIFGFPAPIILAILINEVKSRKFKRVFQTISYMPYFIPTVVICGMLLMFTRTTGVFSEVLSWFGVAKDNWLMRPELFKPILVASDIYQGIGWGTIIYLATLSGISPSLYEAASIDGAGRFRRILHITLPGLMPIITIQLIMTMGRIMSSGFEKIILLYNSITMEKADVIASFVYRRGLQEMDFSFGAAVDLFTAVINLLFLVFANWMARKTTENSLW